MSIFDSDKTIDTQVNADMAYSKSRSNSEDLRRLECRLEKLEEYLELEWSESNQKYYKTIPEKEATNE